MAEEFARNQAQFPLLVAIHGGFGRFYVARGAGLDLDETKFIFVPSNEVEFAAMMWRTVIAGNDDVALPSKIEVSFLFAAAAGALMGWSSLRWKRVRRQPIESPQRDLREATGEHGIPSA